MATATIENYLKQIYLLQPDAAGSLVSMGRLAESMSVVPGTATAMVKRLHESGQLKYEPYAGVKLTARGRRQALRILRRHRLIEVFLVETLGVDWSEIHEEAERLEHAISDRVLDRLDELLGFPAVDPHGDPIPTNKGEIRDMDLRSLADCEIGPTYHIARVCDQHHGFLRFIDREKLRPGCPVVVVGRDSAADSVVIRSGRSAPLTLGAAAAAKILVESPRQAFPTG